ncbi:MAG: bifunctional glutamate--cysteine ligase GshA/glutathione synthetase GshB [Eubacteriales bacterium]
MILEGYKSLELSTQILIKEAFSRRFKVEVLDWQDNFIRIQKGNKIEYIKQATRTSADSYIAPLIMENKEVTKKVLDENGINVPKGFTIQSEEEAEDKFDKVSGKDIVIKPKSTNYGKGVVMLINATRQEYVNAVKYALQYDKYVLVEEFIKGKEYRFLVIGDEVVAILHRVPANVKGDGVHSIKELVEEKNKNPLRGKGYKKPLEQITLGDVEKDYLRMQEKSFDYIPKKEEVVYLRENSNISTGGDSIDFTDDIIDEYKKIAVDSAKVVGAKICGADIIIQDIKAIPNDNNYSIIELNFNPAIHIHDFPYKGKNREVEKKILDLLGFE